MDLENQIDWTQGTTTESDYVVSKELKIFWV